MGPAESADACDIACHWPMSWCIPSIIVGVGLLGRVGEFMNFSGKTWPKGNTTPDLTKMMGTNWVGLGLARLGLTKKMQINWVGLGLADWKNVHKLGWIGLGQIEKNAHKSGWIEVRPIEKKVHKSGWIGVGPTKTACINWVGLGLGRFKKMHINRVGLRSGRLKKSA